jgi:hypothetical protein
VEEGGPTQEMVNLIFGISKEKGAGGQEGEVRIEEDRYSSKRGAQKGRPV